MGDTVGEAPVISQKEEARSVSVEAAYGDEPGDAFGEEACDRRAVTVIF
jgi:hypothetical protein